MVATAMDVLERISQSARCPAPDFPEEFRPFVDAGRDGGTDFAGDPAPGDIAGLTIGIEYCDAAGNVTERRITCRRFDHASGYLWAWCHERNAMRQFRADRIEEIIDWRTGEVIESPLDFLRSFGLTGSGSDPWRVAHDRCSDGIKVLMFIARCDGDVHPEEMEVVARYCGWRCDGDGTIAAVSFDIDRLLRFADRQYPDRETFLTSARKVLGKPKMEPHGKLLMRSVRSLIPADGRIAREETEVLAQLDELLIGYAR